MNVPERAALLGMSVRAVIELAEADPRIFAHPMLERPSSVVRVKRWLAAGRPAPDVARLQFLGHPTVRELICDMIRRLPHPIAWHATEAVQWTEISRAHAGEMRIARALRPVDGDQPHLIRLAGNYEDRELVSIAAHELGHSWGWPVCPVALDAVAAPDPELQARAIIAERIVAQVKGGNAIDRLVREAVAEEVYADSVATACGVRRVTDVAALTRKFRGEHVAAVARADEIEREIDERIERDLDARMAV